MKSENIPQNSLIQKLLKELVPNKAKTPIGAAPTVGLKPLEPSELLQDAGSGYNADFVDPQE